MVRDPDLHAWSVRTVAAAAADLGLGVAGYAAARCPDQVATSNSCCGCARAHLKLEDDLQEALDER